MITTQGKTNVEVYTEVLEALVEQGKQCLNEDDECIYGDTDGNHCGFGWLLPDDNMELMNSDLAANDLIRRFSNLGPNDGFMRENSYELLRFQGLHDSYVNGAYFTDLGVSKDLIDQWLSFEKKT